jgi:hypothetical protein
MVLDSEWIFLPLGVLAPSTLRSPEFRLSGVVLSKPRHVRKYTRASACMTDYLLIPWKDTSLCTLSAVPPSAAGEPSAGFRVLVKTQGADDRPNERHWS